MQSRGNSTLLEKPYANFWAERILSHWRSPSSRTRTANGCCNRFTFIPGTVASDSISAYRFVDFSRYWLGQSGWFPSAWSSFLLVTMLHCTSTRTSSAMNVPTTAIILMSWWNSVALTSCLEMIRSSQYRCVIIGGISRNRRKKRIANDSNRQDYIYASSG